jgi:hypothetical protein
MEKYFWRWLVACGALAQALTATAGPREFSFGVIDHPFKATTSESILQEAIAETDSDNLAFVVVNGIKSNAEPCSDEIYIRRKALLDSAKAGLIVSLAASDWAECKSANGRSAAIGRLNRLRDLFFVDEFSIGGIRIPLTRQSTTAKFRSYGENARWVIGSTMFATINLPGNNNHYLAAAGRNSEFEDRLVANRDWLNRVFIHARRKNLAGIVLFCDGNPIAAPNRSAVRRDGFAETRQQISALAAKFPGKVLVIHGRKKTQPDSSPNIIWRGNLGVLEAGSPWIKLDVDPDGPTLFAIAADSVETKNAAR